MMIVMKADATQEEIDTAISRVEEGGARAHVSTGAERTVIGAVGVDGTQRERLASLATAPGVDRVVPITKPYKLASREFGPDPESTLEIAGRTIGGGAFATIAARSASHHAGRSRGRSSSARSPPAFSAYARSASSADPMSRSGATTSASDAPPCSPSCAAEPYESVSR